jgi:aldose 1-epimerase
MIKRLFCKPILVIYPALLFAACGDNNQQKKANPANNSQKEITNIHWGEADGKEVFLYTLRNAHGAELKISNYGGTIVSWKLPDKNDALANIVVGFDKLENYFQKPPYFGALIGRYANRIGGAKFLIGGKSYQLNANDGNNSLHGGLKGFDKVVWDATITPDSTPKLQLSYNSRDGEEGYPGNLQVKVSYQLTANDELVIRYSAQTDQATPVNLTNHSYFNLGGDINKTILDHNLWINAGYYTPVDSSLIPTGEIKSVSGTPFDFTKTKKIGKDIDQVKGGYDHNFVLDNKDSSLRLAAVLSDSSSGRRLEVFTTEPGLQFYTGNFLDGKFINSDGKPIKGRTALCLETQHFPDSPNKPNFPNTILNPGNQFYSVTVYKFSLMR